MRDVAPSTELRKWYSHDPAKWVQFKQRYLKELQSKHELISSLAKEIKGRKVTFVFGSREEKLNNAAALRDYIETQFK